MQSLYFSTSKCDFSCFKGQPNKTNAMRKALFGILLAGILTSCSKQRTFQTESNETLDSLGNVYFRDAGNSFLFIKYSGDSTKCYDVQSVDYEVLQLAPQGQWNTYVTKQTTITKTCDGQEGQKRSIRVELRPVDHPDRIFFALQHDCDEIYLEHDYYRTVFNGCCDAEPVHKIYDYDGNLLIEGNNEILIGAIPNNPLKFYLSYTPSALDSVIGFVHLVYNKDEKYAVAIQSPPLPPDVCSMFSPEISLSSTRSSDSLDLYYNEYQLWELENIQNIDGFSYLNIQVNYYCEDVFPVESVNIPITRGRPFGKDTSLTAIELVSPLSSTESEP
jgi:hypothetical protein